MSEITFGSDDSMMKPPSGFNRKAQASAGLVDPEPACVEFYRNEQNVSLFHLYMRVGQFVHA